MAAFAFTLERAFRTGNERDRSRGRTLRVVAVLDDDADRTPVLVVEDVVSS
jgi:hypothetical protein